MIRTITSLNDLVSAFGECKKAAFPGTYTLTFKERKESRSIEQNAKMWAMLTDISEQVEWHGQKFSKEDWKDIFTAAMRGQRSAPGIEGGLVFFGERTSKMTMKDMAEMIEYVIWFGTDNEVKWSDPDFISLIENVK